MKTAGGLEFDGFGRDHISDDHGTMVPDPVLIRTLSGSCKPITLNRVRCESDEAYAVYDTGRDPRSPDPDIVGIITSYFNSPFACWQGQRCTLGTSTFKSS